MIIFTLCSNNYLPYALSLGHSIEQENPGLKFIIGLVDVLGVNDIDLFEILPATQIVDSEVFSEMSSWYDVTELNTAVKPYYIDYFFKNGFDKVIYLDPDILVFNKLQVILDLLDRYEAVVTPHFNTPLPIDGKNPQDRDMLVTGVYNLGFLGIKKSDETIRFIDWWKIKLFDQCHVGNGLFTDQLWMVYITCFLDRVKVLRDPGYNVANWNLHERVVSLRDNQYFVNDSFPLVFFHYSNYKFRIPDRLAAYNTRYRLEDRQDIVPLYQRFTNDIIQYGIERYELIRPAYGITRIARKRKKTFAELGYVSKLIIIVLRRIVRSIEFRLNVDIKAKN